MDSICKLKGVIQQYTWGGSEFIPSLLNVPNDGNKPFAEYWLGAHPNASSTLINGEGRSLLQAIKENSNAFLGKRVADKFGSLPYLFKILDVRQMLSIQVHPSKASAIEGFKKEAEAGIPVNASNRNYKDQNHKPELMAALSDFWLLHGFKNKQGLAKIFDEVSQLSFLKPVFEEGGYKTLYEEVMTMPQQKVNEALTSLMREILQLYNDGRLDKSSEHFWAARAATSFCKDDNYDRGIFSIYLFNLLHLKEGQGIYQHAGLPHAYLEGKNVEVMANSDNVLRAGLTDKYIDVPELMKHVIFEATEPKIIEKSYEAEQSFEAPVQEFLLKKYHLQSATNLSTESATVIFVYEGQGAISAAGKKIDIKRGEAVLAIAGQNFSIVPEEPMVCFTVTTPL